MYICYLLHKNIAPVKKIFIIIILLLFVPFIVFPQHTYKKKRKSFVKHSTYSKPKYLTYSGKHGGLFKSNKYTELETGINIGVSQSCTDIGGFQYRAHYTFQDIQWDQTRMCFGIMERYHWAKNIAFNGSIIYAKLVGYDKLAVGTSRGERKKSFTNNIFELATKVEYFLSHPKRLYTPFAYYGYSGLVFFYHNPSLTDPEPDKFDIQLRNTPNLYHKGQIGIPFGIGMLYTLPNFVRVGLDVSWRKTFTDFLDGFTRPYSKFNDGYVFSVVTISYIFKASKQTQFSTHKRQNLNFRRKNN